MINTLFRFYLPVLGMFLAVTACSHDHNALPQAEIWTIDSNENYINQGDIKAIKKHGWLRILTTGGENRLPRQSSSRAMELELATRFAASMKLKPAIIYVENFEDLIPALQDGKGDIIAANLTVTPERKEHISFTVPLGHAKEQLVSAKAENISDIASLQNRSIAVMAGTTYEQTLDQLLEKYPGLKKQTLPGNLDLDEILNRIAAREIDLAILDDNLLQEASEYRSDFNKVFSLTEERPLAWALRKDSTELQTALNRYLNQQQLTRPRVTVHLDDFDDIKQRKTLRVLTRNNAASYYLWQGELLGFEYELAKAFASKHNLRLEMIVAPSHEDLIPMLLAGRGDVIAAFMTVTDERKRQDIAFSRHHHYSSEIVVSRDDDDLKTVDDLAGRTIHVRRSSSYWRTLEILQEKGIAFELVAAPETMETEEIIARVADDDYDLTVADNQLLDIELTWRDDIKAAFALGEPRKNAWAVRKKNKQLLSAINSFLKQEYRGEFYNITYEKYFKNSHIIKQHKEERIDLNPDGSISPFDDIVKQYAAQYGFDWKMLVSQMYQESRFDPNTTSWAGARGLMQVLPRTAHEMGFKQLDDAETGIHAGVKYLDWVRDRFETELDVKDRMWFSLAAYNAGVGHVKDARILARQMGFNPNRWFNHVEKTMLLLAKRQYSRSARHGYVRGVESVKYVREIRNRYQAYLQLSGSDL